MTQAPTPSRSILPGVLAGTFVFVLGLLFIAPGPSAGDSPPTHTRDRQPSPPSTEGLASEPVAPAVGRQESLPVGEALRHRHSTRRGVEARNLQPGALLVPRGGMPGTEAPDWLAHFRGRWSVPSHPPLHVLFCTWLA
jgi:hypothetical protein